MTPDDLAALDPDLLAAATAAGDDPLRAAGTLRRTGTAPALAAAALTQVALRRAAVGKFGADAGALFFTRTGLEQATRAPVARRRAHRLVTAGVRSVADLGCGIGADALALARLGVRVHAVDADPVTAAVAARNARALGLGDLMTVVCADARSVDLSGVDAVFCDPARRTAGGRRVFDPSAYSPPWDFVTALPTRVPRTVLKLAPGIDHARLPPGAEGEWVSVDGDVVEACAWCGPLASAAHRATVLRGGAVSSLTGSGTARAAVGPVRAFLYDPDGAVVRAHLVAELAARLDATIADETIAYLYADTRIDTPYARAYEIREVLPFSLKRLRARLRDLGVGRVTIKKRGSALDPDQLRRDLRLSPAAAGAMTVVLTRVAGAPVAILCTDAAS